MATLTKVLFISPKAASPTEAAVSLDRNPWCPVEPVVASVLPEAWVGWQLGAWKIPWWWWICVMPCPVAPTIVLYYRSIRLKAKPPSNLWGGKIRQCDGPLNSGNRWHVVLFGVCSLSGFTPEDVELNKADSWLLLNLHAQNQPWWCLLSYRTREAFPRLGFGVRSEKEEAAEEEEREITPHIGVQFWNVQSLCHLIRIIFSFNPMWISLYPYGKKSLPISVSESQV